MNVPRIIELKITIHVASKSSCLVDHDTFFSSPTTSKINFLTLAITARLYFLSLQAWQDSNLQRTVLETVALPIRATGLRTLFISFAPCGPCASDKKRSISLTPSAPDASSNPWCRRSLSDGIRHIQIVYVRVPYNFNDILLIIYSRFIVILFRAPDRY